MNFHPIEAILLFLSLLFAPADTRRIDIRGVDYSATVAHGETGWRLEGREGGGTIAIDGTRLVEQAGGEARSIDLKAFVSKALGHDLGSGETLAFSDDAGGTAFVIERTPDGFSLRNDRGTEGIHNFTISYVGSDPAGGPACSVLGAVKQPGIVALQDGDTLRSVLLKAGGPAGQIEPPLVWLLRGSPGEKFSRREGFQLSGVLEGRHQNVRLDDRDILYLEPTLLLEIAADGSLVLDGRPCPASSLAPRLREGIAAGVRSATLRSHPDTPYERISPLVDTFLSNGIPADRLKFTVGSGD